MNDAATPNATHMPRRCRLMWRRVIAERQRLVRREQERRAGERQPHQRPRPRRTHRDRRERDRDQVEEAERVERPAGQVEQAREQQHVQRHHRRQPGLPRPPAGAPAARTRGCCRSRSRPAPASGTIGISSCIAKCTAADRDQLAADRRPAQADQPVEVDAIRIPHAGRPSLRDADRERGLVGRRPTPAADRASAPSSRP